VKAYAAHKGLALRGVDVRAAAGTRMASSSSNVKCGSTGDLDDAQRARLIEIAGRCPVTKTLAREIKIRTA
jgi:uncharacterized OsmC-like protein